MKLLAIASAAAALLLAGSAACDPLAPHPGAPGGHGPVKVMVIVSSHGLDLSSPGGAEQFLQRLDSAVNRACDDRPAGPPRSLGRSPAFRECRAKALETAMTYVRSPLVRERYAQLRAKDSLRLARR